MPFSRIKVVGGSGAIPVVLMVLTGRNGAGRAGRGGDGPPPGCGCGGESPRTYEQLKCPCSLV